MTVVRKYQAFISSPFKDLRDVRESVTWELLKLGLIPVGMENFSADPDRGWSIIERTIDESDYYVLILAGRYGSIDQTKGMSWTEAEYKYALSKQVPVFAFVRSPDEIAKSDCDEGKPAERLKDFVALLRSSHRCEEWTTPDDLRARVANAFAKRIRIDEQGTPRPGWYRGEAPVPTAISEELARLSRENSDLRGKLAEVERAAPLPVLQIRGARLDVVLNSGVVKPEKLNTQIYIDLFVAPQGRGRIVFPAHEATLTVEGHEFGVSQFTSGDALISATQSQVVIDGPGLLRVQGKTIWMAPPSPFADQVHAELVLRTMLREQEIRVPIDLVIRNKAQTVQGPMGGTWTTPNEPMP